MVPTILNDLALFPFPPTCKFLQVSLLTTLSDYYEIYTQTNKATTNIFGLHAQPRKTTRYTYILKLVCGRGKAKRANDFHHCSDLISNYHVFPKQIK